jgi:hypothetical protein
MIYNILLIILLLFAIIWFFGWSGIAFLVSLFVLILVWGYVRNVQKKKDSDNHAEEIAKYFLKENIDEVKIENSKKFVSLYDEKLKRLKKEVKNKESQYKREYKDDSFFNFGHDDKLKLYEKELDKAKTDMDSYELENKKQYDACFMLLNRIDIKFYDEHKIEIKNKIKALKDVENQKQLEIQEQLRKEQLELVKKKREENNKLIEKKSRSEKVAKSIRDMEDYIPVLKDHVVKNHSLDAHMFKQLRSLLNMIKKNIEFVNPKDYSNIEQMKLLIEDIFSKENSGNFNVEKKIITDSISRIIANIKH